MGSDRFDRCVFAHAVERVLVHLTQLLPHVNKNMRISGRTGEVGLNDTRRERNAERALKN